MFKKIYISFFIFLGLNTYSQNIKSIQLRPQQENNFSSIVPLGTVLELSFDDLDTDSKDYQYRIEHMTHNWEKSRLLASQFIDGFDENTIIDVTNSFNTFQNYTHYSVQIPNINTVITKSGNYLLSILNDDDEVVFTRKFVLYEKTATIGVTASRSRNAKTINTQQTIEFTVNHPNLRINNPSQEVNVVVLKNENWNEKIDNIQPTFFKQNQLKYTYTNKTNFWGGNEYLNFDSKFIRNKSVSIVKIEMKDISHQYLYPETYTPNKQYKYNPDINGQFVIRTLDANIAKTEADYAMMHFTLYADEPFLDKNVYIYGAFNNFKVEEENKMYYNNEEGIYQGEILLKQGFYNFNYMVENAKTKVAETMPIEGSFSESSNQYRIYVYLAATGLPSHDKLLEVVTLNTNR